MANNINNLNLKTLFGFHVFRTWIKWFRFTSLCGGLVILDVKIGTGSMSRFFQWNFAFFLCFDTSIFRTNLLTSSLLYCIINLPGCSVRKASSHRPSQFLKSQHHLLQMGTQAQAKKSRKPCAFCHLYLFGFCYFLDGDHCHFSLLHALYFGLQIEMIWLSCISSHWLFFWLSLWLLHK